MRESTIMCPNSIRETKVLPNWTMTPLSRLYDLGIQLKGDKISPNSKQRVVLSPYLTKRRVGNPVEILDGTIIGKGLIQ